MGVGLSEKSTSRLKMAEDSVGPADTDGGDITLTPAEEDTMMVVDDNLTDSRAWSDRPVPPLDDVVTARNSDEDVSFPQATPPQPKVDTTEQKKKLLNVILKAVINGHATVVVKAMEALKEHCDIQSQPVGGQLLDFLPDKHSTTLHLHIPEAHKFHSPLMIACEKERQDLVKLLLDQGASVAFKNKDKLTALHIACNKGNLAIVELLLQHVAEQKRFTKKAQHTSDLILAVNVRNERGWTPLMYAIKGGHVEIVNKLIETGQIDYQIKNKKHCSILHIASGGSKVECLEKVFAVFEGQDNEMILAKDKNGWNVLHHACTSANKEVLKWLLDHLSEEDRTKLIDQQHNAGYTPCLKACEYQNIDALKMLLEHGADVSLCAKDRDSKKNVKEEGEKSALHIAAIHDNKEIAQLLLEKECPIDIVDSEGNSPLHVAYRKSSFEVIAVLTQTGDGKLETLTNNEKKRAFEVTPEDVIPPEIKKRGKVAVDLYKKALKEGKKKIPRCNLLILGQQRVGKTSVYRLLVGLKFIEDLDPTLGIDNNTVDTLDKRLVDIDKWEQKSEDAQKEQSKELFAGGVVENVRDKLPPLKNKSQKGKPVACSEPQLLKDIEDAKGEIVRKKQASIYATDALTKKFRMMELSRAAAVTSQPRHQQPTRTETRPTVSHIASAPPPDEPPKSVPMKEHSETPTLEPVQLPLTKPEPVTKQPPSRPAREEHQPVRLVTDEPAPPPPKPALPPEAPGARVGRKDSQSINKLLKSKEHQKEEEASLILTTLDFAGQPEYRPMHHCFIRRRAIYIVVCNLQDMLECLDAKKSGEKCHHSLEELRYWIHSIHAHIYPPDKDERKRDEKMTRICLVGTHKDPPKDSDQGRKVTEDELVAINDLLEDEIRNDDRCVDHVHRMKSTGRLFVAVENSIDGKSKGDRMKSGAKTLQDELKYISKHLEFLKEDRPIVWLQFESELVHLREYRNSKSMSMIIKLKEFQELAQRLGIIPEAQDVAFQFFHDIGKIVYFKRMRSIFLNEQEREELADLVILDPAWLIKVMKVIFEMDKHGKVSQKRIRDLENTGFASSELLKECWTEFTSCTSFQQLCLMLQAHCLIYPLSCDTCPERAASDPTQSKNSPPTPPTRNVSDPSQISDKKETFYLVPCKLPKENKTSNCEPPLHWQLTFYFDFHKFLPEEIYHRLICLLLANTQGKGSKKKGLVNTYSNTCCTFHNVDGCHWKIGLDRLAHQLKVSVVFNQCNEGKLSHYITKVHEDYLLKICQDSNLQGLEYCGGPLERCTDPKCNKKEVVEFVWYEDGKSHFQSSPQCSFCFKEYNVDDLLKAQLCTAKAEECKVQSKRKEPTITEDSSEPTTETSTVSQDTSHVERHARKKDPSIRNLTLIKWTSEGETHRLNIVRSIAPKWREAGILLGIAPTEVEIISKRYPNEPVDCCREAFNKWLEGGGSQTDYKTTWSGVIELLEDLLYGQVAKNLTTALEANEIYVVRK